MSRHTLLLRLAGPMQSWGVQSRFSRRETALEPTKSGVVGLVCAALGRPREADVSDLAALRLGVRVDREGALRRDYHTAGKEGFIRARGAVEREDVVLSHRFYLADAAFLVGLEGNDGALDLLREVRAALRRPVWSLALGRKGFPPGAPVHLPNDLPDALCEGTPLLDALRSYPRIAAPGKAGGGLRFAIEPQRSTDAELAAFEPVTRTQPDQPLSFAPRRFALREVAIFHDNLAAESAP